MIIDTEKLRHEIEEHYHAFRVTDLETALDPPSIRRQLDHDAERVETLERLTKAERLVGRFGGESSGRATNVVRRLYAFVCAHTGDGNATGIDLELFDNSPGNLRAEADELLPSAVRSA